MGKQRGFTLIEMIIVVVIAAVLVGLAIPNLSEFVNNNKRTTRINSLITALNLARSEAVKLNRTVTVCPSGVGAASGFTTCNTTNAGHYAAGWIVFVDFDSGQDVDAGTDTILRIWDPDMDDDGDPSTTPTLRAVQSVGGTAVAAFSYLGTGFPSATPGNTHVVYCDTRGQAEARAIRFSTTGQPRVTTLEKDDSDGDDIPEVPIGTDITC